MTKNLIANQILACFTQTLGPQKKFYELYLY